VVGRILSYHQVEEAELVWKCLVPAETSVVEEDLEPFELEVVFHL
jgi:hypothetical protein